MRYRLLDSLGLNDARYCNEHLGAGLDTDAAKLAKGAFIELPEKAAEYLSGKYPGLLGDAKADYPRLDKLAADKAAAVKGVAKKPEVTAPAK